MQPHTRAIIAAASHALVTGRKVAGLYDHAAKRHLRIAAEARGEHLQGYDGDRNARFGGTLPQLHDIDADALVHVELEKAGTRCYDHASSSHFTTKVAERLVQVYDHAAGTWFSFDVQVA